MRRKCLTFGAMSLKLHDMEETNIKESLGKETKWTFLISRNACAQSVLDSPEPSVGVCLFDE